VRVTGKVVSLTQQAHVFRGTMADNPRLADPDADDDRLRRVLVLAGVGEVPGASGLEQRIGPRGRALSPGEACQLRWTPDTIVRLESGSRDATHKAACR